MKNSKVLFDDFVKRIRLNESPDEIFTMAFWTIEKLFGVSRTEILLGKDLDVTTKQEEDLLNIIERINRQEPIQYVLGEADFYGRKFFVNDSVLIPRPETEELAAFIIEQCNKKTNLRILDIGTGSGCIPITLSLEVPGSTVFATDVSYNALEVAIKNAGKNSAQVNFIRHDMLAEDIPVKDLDVIVSNPPYITKQETPLMRPNVVKYEPHQALFVPDNDPFVFYTVIISKARTALKKDGLLAFEINEKYGSEVSSLMQVGGFGNVKVVTDLSGKNRIVAGVMRSSS
jgi:release factor glutamine methyltransferase